MGANYPRLGCGSLGPRSRCSAAASFSWRCRWRAQKAWAKTDARGPQKWWRFASAEPMRKRGAGREKYMFKSETRVRIWEHNGENKFVQRKLSHNPNMATSEEKSADSKIIRKGGASNVTTRRENLQRNRHKKESTHKGHKLSTTSEGRLKHSSLPYQHNLCLAVKETAEMCALVALK